MRRLSFGSAKGRSRAQASPPPSEAGRRGVVAVHLVEEVGVVYDAVHADERVEAVEAYLQKGLPVHVHGDDGVYGLYGLGDAGVGDDAQGVAPALQRRREGGDEGRKGVGAVGALRRARREEAHGAAVARGERLGHRRGLVAHEVHLVQHALARLGAYALVLAPVHDVGDRRGGYAAGVRDVPDGHFFLFSVHLSHT